MSQKNVFSSQETANRKMEFIPLMENLYNTETYLAKWDK